MTENNQLPLRNPYPASGDGLNLKPGRPKAKASSRRTAAGIVGIVLGVFLLLLALVMLTSTDTSTRFISWPIILAALGSITGGTLMLAKGLATTQWVPMTLLGSTVAAVLLGIAGPLFLLFNLAFLMVVLALAIPLGILVLPELAERRRRATPQQTAYPPTPYIPGNGQHTQAPVNYIQGTAAAAHQMRQLHARSSGLLMAAGIVAIVLGAWELAASTQGYAMYVDYDGNVHALLYMFLFLGLGLASAAAGIVLLVLLRRKNSAVLIVLLSLSTLAILVAASSTARGLYAVMPTVLTVLLAVTVIILLVIALAKSSAAPDRLVA